jgi:16S rRNA C967 or C1407 C5-methylase (RsmB/RsmF family)
MATIQEQSENQIKELLADLHLENLQGKEREQVVEMLRSRFSEVVFNTTVRILPEELKVEYIKAASDPEANSAKIIEITSQVPELAEALEAALLFEFEALKHSMTK